MRKTKILAVNNSPFYEENKSLFLDKETGLFFTGLNELGNAVSLFQISELMTVDASFASFKISDRGLFIYEVKRRNNRFIPFFKSFFVIQKAILKNDFIYVYYPGPICQVITLFCILYRKPFGVYVRGEQGILTFFSRFILRNADIIFTVSPRFSNQIFSLNSNTQTIRPMIGFNESDILKPFDIVFNNSINILYVGRLVFDKGIFELIEALSVLVNNGGNFHLNLVGPGPDAEKLRDFVNIKGLERNVSFFGMVSDSSKIKEIYRNNDVFILPSYHEGFPRVLYEAMMMRIPILTTFVGTIDYIMKDKYNCLKILPKDVNSIVNRVEELVSNAELAQVIVDNGAATILNYLSDKKENHAKQLNDFIASNL